jgi:hypothetical protein
MTTGWMTGDPRADSRPASGFSDGNGDAGRAFYSLASKLSRMQIPGLSQFLSVATSFFVLLDNCTKVSRTTGSP